MNVEGSRMRELMRKGVNIALGRGGDVEESGEICWSLRC
jgi:hypothetical protein